MTEDYKKNLLRYFTGKFEQETENNTPQFGNYKVTNNNTRKQIANELSTDISNIRILGNLSSPRYETSILYGYNLATSKRFISIFNKEMELIQVIQKFSSGSDLFYIISMQIDEEGKIYGLSQDVENNNVVLRVLLFENIFTSNSKTGIYSVNLRKTYIVQVSNFKCNSTPPKDVIKKVQGEATYYITGTSNSDGSYTKVVKFQINVGSENTWDMYTVGQNVYYAQSKFTILINKEENGHFYLAYAVDVINKKYVVYKIDSEGNITNVKSINLSSYAFFQTTQVLAVNNDVVYLALSDSSNHITTLYKIQGTQLDFIESTTWYQLPDESFEVSVYNLQNINNNIFVTKYQPMRYGVEVFFGMIIDATIHYKSEGQESSIMVEHDNYSMTSAFNETYISNQYNLYNIYINSDYNDQVSESCLNNLTLIYNANNYNGFPYKALNSLVPNSAILYDSNDDIIFARNLYNKTIFGATTTSTVEIPNTLLNDITITQNNLIGETNITLVNDIKAFSKNIYETVNINFANTLSIRNDNDINSKILNPIGSARLNNSISQTIDYTNAQATKIKINYLDGTDDIVQLGNSQITLMSEYVARYTFNIYVKEEINDVQIISYDENTIYQTINNLNLEIGKIYNFIQYVSIIEDFTQNEVLYENEQVLYENDIVNYVN